MMIIVIEQIDDSQQTNTHTNQPNNSTTFLRLHSLLGKGKFC